MSSINVPDLATFQAVGSTGVGGDYPNDAEYIQTAAIDGSDTATWNDDGGGGYFGFDPIGASGAEFIGTYDGAGYEITDLFINRPAEDYVGAFGSCIGADILDLGVADCDITGNERVGGIVGDFRTNATMAGCYATGAVTAGGTRCGGIAGIAFSGTAITGCHSTCAVTGGGAYTGGLAGLNFTNSTIAACYATGTVTGGGNYTGGLVGINQATSTITGCYATGAVAGGGHHTGGFCGYNVADSTITACISTGAATSTDTVYLGPFLGRGLETNETGGKIAVAQAQLPDTYLAFGWDYAATWKQAVVVPNVVGATLDAAAEALALARLGIGTITNAYSESVPAGNVISQSVAAGGTGGYPRLQWEDVAGTATGTDVDLTVSLGVETVVIPNAISETEAAGVALIEGAGLVASVVYAAATEEQRVFVGFVVGQTPSSGKVVLGTTVVLAVLTTPVNMTVPSVLCIPQADAVTAIEAQAFTATVATAYSDTVPAGNVISQDPGGGTQAAYGSAVGIAVSLGVEMRTVPDVLGETQASATSRLTGDGFTVAVETAYSDTATEGNVISQDPPRLTVVAYGSEVEITVSLGAEPRTVPGVLCLSEAAATALIEGEGLVASVTTGYSATTPAGFVAEQSPDAGATVDYQSTVAIVVSLGREPMPGNGIMADLAAVRTVLSESANFQAFAAVATAAEALDKIKYFAADAALMPMGVVAQGGWERNRVTLDSHYLTSPEVIISLYRTVDAGDSDSDVLVAIVEEADAIMADLEQQEEWRVQVWGPDEETPERAGHDHDPDFVSVNIAVSGIIRS